MRAFLLALVCASTLSACAFAPSRDLYAGYRQDFGTWVTNAGVSTFCFAPGLRLAILGFESFFGRKVVVSSGYRDPWHNADVGG